MGYEFFQRQFASVMENLLHSAVSETNKLFEGAVQELRAELTCMRRENDKVKSNLRAEKNRMFTCEKLTHKRDIGVQCEEVQLMMERSSWDDPTLDDGKSGISNESSDKHHENGDDQPFTLLLIKPEEAEMYDFSSGRSPPKHTEDLSDNGSAQHIQTMISPQDTLACHVNSSPPISGMSASPWSSPLSIDRIPLIRLDTPLSGGNSNSDRAEASAGQYHKPHPEKPPMSPQSASLPLNRLQAGAASESQLTLTIDDTMFNDHCTSEIHQQGSLSQQTTPQHQPRRFSNRQSKSVYRRPLDFQTVTIGRTSETPVSVSCTSKQVQMRCLKDDDPPNWDQSVTDQSSCIQSDGSPMNQNQCVVCDLVLSSASALRNHWRVHMVERDSVCLHCGKIFPNTSSLRSHLPVHESSGSGHQSSENEEPQQIERDSQSAAAENGKLSQPALQVQPRRLSTRETKSVYRRPLAIQTPQPREENSNKKNVTLLTVGESSEGQKAPGRIRKQKVIRKEQSESEDFEIQGFEKREQSEIWMGDHNNSISYSLGSLQGSFNESTSCICGCCGEGFYEVESLRRHLLTHTMSKDHRLFSDVTAMKLEESEFEIDSQHSQNFTQEPREDQLVRRSKRMSKSVYRRPLMQPTREWITESEFNKHDNASYKHPLATMEQKSHLQQMPKNEPVLYRFDFSPGEGSQSDGRQLYLSPQKNADEATLIQSGKHQCTVCGLFLSSKNSLRRHQEIHKKRRMVCELCDKTFFRKKDFKIHFRQVHCGHKRYPCGVCGKNLSSTESLARHMPIHLKKKPFNCSLCGKTFQHESSLTLHMIRHERGKHAVFKTFKKSKR